MFYNFCCFKTHHLILITFVFILLAKIFVFFNLNFTNLSNSEINRTHFKIILKTVSWKKIQNVLFTYMLCDSPKLLLDNFRVPEGIQKRRLSVVHVPHDGDDGRSRLQILFCWRRSRKNISVKIFLFFCGLCDQFHPVATPFKRLMKQV